MTVSSKVSWGHISLFYIIAFAISALFNSGFLVPFYQKLTDGLLIKNWPFLPAGIGTLAAALIAFKFDKNLSRTITLTGNNRSKNILISIVPLLVFSALGLSNDNGLNAHYYGFVFAMVTLIYAVSEEIFWRSYLLDKLRATGKFTCGLVIGILWWAWHFRFTTTFDWTWFLLICAGSSLLLCQFADETKSYLTAAGLHSLIILTTSEGEMNKSKVTGLCVSIVIWLIIGKFWKAPKLGQH